MARSFTNTTENDTLNWLFGSSGYTPHPSSLVLRLSTTLPTDAGGITEPTGGAYVEQAITFGAAASGVVANTNTITFPTATVPWGTLLGWAVRDTTAAVTLATGYMGAYFDNVYSVFLGGDYMHVVGATAPANDLEVFLSHRDPDGRNLMSPSALGFENSGLTYWVVNSGISGADTFQVAATRGGAAVTLDDQLPGCLIFLSKTATVNTGDQLVFAPGAITISLK